jgi:hypothetical protein
MGRDLDGERSRMTLRPLAAALLAASAFGVAACGGNDPSPASSSSGTAADDDKLREAQVKFAQCMREQGIDMPDPKPGGGPQTFKVGGDSGIDPQEFERASKECDKYRKDIRPELSEEEQQEFKERALEWARCMREQGIDVPDPQFGGDGEVRIMGGPQRMDPEDPEFQAAQKECGEPGGRRP